MSTIDSPDPPEGVRMGYPVFHTTDPTPQFPMESPVRDARLHPMQILVYMFVLLWICVDGAIKIWTLNDTIAAKSENVNKSATVYNT